MEAPTTESLEQLANRIRKHSLRMTQQAKSSHVGSAFSMAELLAVLYGEVLQVDPQQPEDPERDRLVLSKGHACSALYAVLAESGFFPLDWLDSFYHDGARLPGHATAGNIPGVEVSTGSLGHGLPIATGLAMGGKLDGSPRRTYCLLSDGECDEGSVWEAALYAGHHQLQNLTVIIDYNKIQSLSHTDDVLSLEPFPEKWTSFGWHVHEVDGHDVDQLRATLGTVDSDANKPTCVIAHTVKGKGVSFMEDTVLWHYRSPQGEEYAAALAELEAA